MICLSRALPSLRASASSLRAPMNRIPQFTTQPSASRQFSSLLSSPVLRHSPLQMQSSISRPTSAPTTVSSITSLLAQSEISQGQTRAFSATASLGVRRVTFRPSRRVQKRRHGFLSRSKTNKGRQTLTHRRSKGRKNLSW
ncbi:Ribosomal protein L34 [Penicillium malachiteum]|uniref:Ribosomal protein L34 n=1 Tax=Penicillium malachiteum TaxID=1324776 RepID=A0AAD6N112_9EURO|nr:Ribosomal protein L34 [Penicillium malachiteum]